MPVSAMRRLFATTILRVRRRPAPFLLALGFVLVPALSHAARGGPDAGSWTWADSQEPGVSSLVEVPAVMTTIMSPPLVDEAVYPVDLSFPFTLHGTTSSRVWLSTNGWISLRDPGASPAPLNRPIPTPGVPEAVTAWAWGNLELGLAQVGSNSRGDVIEVHYYHRGLDLWLEGYIEFLRAGAIGFYYTNGAPPTSAATIGIEDGFGSRGTQIVYNGTVAPGVAFSTPYALMFYAPSPLDCSSAVDYPACQPSIVGTTVGGSAAVNNYACDALAHAGAERVYRIDRPGLGRFQASLSNLGGRDLALYLISGGCHPGFGCVAGGGPSIDVPGLARGTYFLVVDGSSAVDDGDFTLTVSPSDADCNRNGVGDSCDILAGTSTDCDSNGRPDECGNCAVDVVFMMDTSGSMVPYFTPLCDAIAATVAQLSTQGIDFTSQMWGITDNGSGCLTDNVRNRLGGTVPGSPAPPLDLLTSSESWGQAASIAAALYPWTPGAVRVVVPIGDEGPYQGEPVFDPGDDRDVVTHAISVCLANRVIASPITPDLISNPGNVLLAQDLAAGTGGTWSSTGVNMGDAILNLVEDACTLFLPSADAGPDVAMCSPGSVRLDGSGSRPTCAGALEYRWLEGTNEPCGGWSPTPICDVTPAASTTYTLEVRCLTASACAFTDTMQVTIGGGPLAALAATPPAICPGDAIALDASGTNPNGCPTGLEYQFREGAAILQPWSPISSHGPLLPATTTTYDVDVRCGACATTSQATVTVEPRPTAFAGGPPLVCAGNAAILDGTGSNGCPGALEYRWLDGATPVCNWSTAATCLVSPAVATVYTLETRCQGGICEAATTWSVDVAPRPVAAVSPSQNVCAPGPVQLDASTSTTSGCPGGALYEWWQGATMIRAASPVATYVPTTTVPGTLTYTVLVSCAGLPGCDDRVDVTVTVRDCSLSVHFDTVTATRVDRGHVAIAWRTSSELGSVLFAVERATSPAGPFVMIGTTPALGSGASYLLTDEVDTGAGLWYRVVEHTVDGRGDESAAVAASAVAMGHGGTRARSRATTR